MGDYISEYVVLNCDDKYHYYHPNTKDMHVIVIDKVVKEYGR